MQILVTKRLNLREIAESDDEFILGLLNQPTFIKYIGNRGVNSLETARQAIKERYRESYIKHGFGLYIVEIKSEFAPSENGVVPIGFCGFVKRDDLPDPDIKIVKDDIADESKIPAEDVMRSETKKAAAATLKKLKIVPGNTGELLVARLLTDLNAEKIEPGGENKNQIVKFTDYRDSNYFENEYELHLKTSKVDLKRCEYNYEPTLKFELLLKDGRGDMEKILQKDKDLPESRSCPHTYSVQNVYTYKNKIAVFINVYTIGFEGPDMRFMIVTGNFK